ncbi:MAG: MoaD/ThiS family protein [Synergistetes bacterium]|nr:MAG: MoaD family protein [bacterium 42_11]MBC7332392.1 MoaD/ThiS family protein [Synergistota bacterium]MDK2872139.1 sulfur-carrier protein [bacterium]
MVKVKLFATLAQIARKRMVEVEATTASELLEKLSQIYGEEFRKELEGGMIFLVNGINIEHLDGLNTPLKDGDTVSIFPPIGGG